VIFLSDADVVLPDRLVTAGTIVIDGDRIIDVVQGAPSSSAADLRISLPRHTIVPGFIDVHVHGLEGIDALDGGDAVARLAQRLPRYGVTALCTTTVACAPHDLRALLAGVRAARLSPSAGAARVLPAHLESNFINPDFRGAQPMTCLRTPSGPSRGGAFTGDDILAEIARARAQVGIVTMAPELEGALTLIADLVRHGHRVSIGHSGATYEEAIAGVDAGARHATHLYNRMTPIGHRSPGVVGAVYDRPEVIAEVICDGFHVHPAAVRTALAVKGADGLIAITDGTAGSGLPRGSKAMLGGRPITVGDVASLDDGTFAGSVLTMDGAFRMLVNGARVSLVVAARMCATTPAAALGLPDLGSIRPGAIADLVMLGPRLEVVRTMIAGQVVFSV
jgi:N-acetylglucosamine-6-phosphate deacetylase